MEAFAPHSAFEKTTGTGFRTVARRYARRSALFESRLLRSPACQNRRPDPPNPAELAAAPSTPSEPADRPPTQPATELPADHAIPTSLLSTHGVCACGGVSGHSAPSRCMGISQGEAEGTWPVIVSSPAPTLRRRGA